MPTHDGDIVISRTRQLRYVVWFVSEDAQQSPIRASFGTIPFETFADAIMRAKDFAEGSRGTIFLRDEVNASWRKQ
jgi:hypothetical protein